MTDRDGYSESADAQGRVWRHYAVWDLHHDVRIVVSEAHDLRNRLVRSIAMHLAAPLLLGLPILVALLWLSIGQGLRPLRTLSNQIASQKPDHLLPLDALNAPREVLPIVQAVNDLLLRMNNSLESERRFTANAAHELRTPLAAIQAQLYVARSVASDDEREQAMTQLQRGVERGIRLVDQLLILARLDPEQHLPGVARVDLARLTQDVCAEIAPLALQRGQTLELEAAPGLPQVPGNADMLAMLLCNLIDNAIRYTQPGGHIRVDVYPCESGVQLDVTDNGPGISAAQREQVFERFYRIAAQSQPGTGLGLAICQRIAELHHTRVTLSPGPNDRGVTASLCLAS
jgi:two-component system sensor histidine kinase QseC